MRKILFFLSFFLTLSLSAQLPQDYSMEQVEVHIDDHVGVIMGFDVLFIDQWSALPQPLFWKQIMTLSPDTVLINVAATRQILCKMSLADWHALGNTGKSEFKTDLRNANNINAGEELYVTTGKNDFYKFDDVYPSLSKGVSAFEDAGVDPWYAQAILLIESPGQLKKSNAGAYGAFQLMPGVARAQGLTVNRYRDDRTDFYKSAQGAAGLLSSICIPEAKKILNAHNIAFEENEVWFRLFVLHIYHAGAGNVAAVVNKINPSKGGQELIKDMWQNKAASFGNNSQNYTQLALASQLILHDIVVEKSHEMYFCKFP
ncbi:MAG: transglycosylase SLT domain-containing protein [Emcibacteraceae bacterium]|nr:transglycosylase SLT domain-containing protein [Emcibacteraceae bacterium]